ncbi:MAG: DUF1501 domain-containing protein, partial [Phycisphaerae bacterium]
MLNFFGKARKALCNGVSRRQFLEIGSLGTLGLSLSDLIRSDAAAAELSGLNGRRSPRSVILVWQHGGPSQLDTFDMKPGAPSEVRGPWRSIATSLPGLEIGELCPEQAKVMDRCTVIRSFSHSDGDHWAAAHWMLTGRHVRNWS